ncbi:hypothetical protein GGR56DRAFT_371196 [Xylariaceae sp. FL0804]|nr:hypothetical protein GGR56DRAFT_371196 [Xylariaceae sp. FL0804]
MMASITALAAVSRTRTLLGLLAWSLVTVASADQPTTGPVSGVPGDVNLTLSLATQNYPDYTITIAPLTEKAGLNSSSIANAVNVQGTLESVDESNFNNISFPDTIALMSCDSNTATSFISPSDMLGHIMENQDNLPGAVVLYTTTDTSCSLGGSDLPYTSVFTMMDSRQASLVKNITAGSKGTVTGRVQGNGTFGDSGAGSTSSGNNSAVAMSVLYSITGLITLLFLIIIATGAVRAHRHPERYGPRAGSNGRSRQSRAKGLARAVLETLPIVKFGDPEPNKPDAENELGSVSTNGQSPSTQGRSDVVQEGAEQSTPSGAITGTGASSVPAEASRAEGSSAASPKTEDQPVGDENPGCSICTEDFARGEDVRVLPCNHKFHPNCVDPWLINVSGTCPMCRLDLRPQGERTEGEEADSTEAPATASTEDAGSSQLAPPVEGDATDPAVAHRCRRSRLLDWNRLRHASVDERLQALRQYRQSQQGAAHPTLSERMRERFHIRTRAHTGDNSTPSNS